MVANHIAGNISHFSYMKIGGIFGEYRIIAIVNNADVRCRGKE